MDVDAERAELARIRAEVAREGDWTLSGAQAIWKRVHVTRRTTVAADLRDLARDALVTRIHVEWRLGRILKVTPHSTKSVRFVEGSAGRERLPSLRDLGIDRWRAGLWLRLGELSHEELVRRLEQAQRENTTLELWAILDLAWSSRRVGQWTPASPERVPKIAPAPPPSGPPMPGIATSGVSRRDHADTPQAEERLRLYRTASAALATLALAQPEVVAEAIPTERRQSAARLVRGHIEWLERLEAALTVGAPRDLGVGA